MKSSAPSIRTRLARLILLASLPGFAAPAALIWSDYLQARDRTYQNALGVATNLAVQFDEQLSKNEAVIRALSTSPALDAGDLASFYEQAQAIVKGSVLEHVILAEPTGRRVINTMVPFGTAIPGQMDEQRLLALQLSDAAVVSPLINGRISHRPLFSISVPVIRNHVRRYHLTASIEASALQPLLEKAGVRPGWIVSIIDSKGIIAARNRDSTRYVGTLATEDVRSALLSRQQGTYEGFTKDAVPVFVAFTHSHKSDWAIGVGVPTEILLGEVRRRLAWLLGAMAVVLAGLLTFAWRMGDGIARAIHGLEAPARALGTGDEVVVPPLGLKEADELGAVLAQAHKMLHSAENRASTDALTGLGNRSMFSETMKLSKAAADRSGEPFSVLYLDLDRFKPVNDAYGHAAGDEVLKEVGHRIRSTLRQSDIAVRLGGDEFAVILPRATHANAEEAAHKLSENLSTPYVIEGIGTVHVSCSVGVSTYPFDGNTVDALVSAADQHMYRQKSGKPGRNVTG